jgi:hypothetical protein
MSSNFEECEIMALKLPPDRATLAARLIASLDTLDEAENENLWVQEAEQRYQAYKQGNISAKSTEEVFRETRLDPPSRHLRMTKSNRQDLVLPNHLPIRVY